MSEQPFNERTVDSSFVEQFQSICREFSAVWDKALQGGEPPRVEDYLGRFAEPERAVLQRKLRSITQEYEQRQLRGRNDTEDPPTVVEERTLLEKPDDVTKYIGSNTQSDRGSVLSEGDATAGDHAATLIPADPSQLDLGRTSEFTPSPDDAPAVDDASSHGRPGPSSTASLHVPGYEINEELGRGGMGVVYRARQVRLNREVALKMVLAGAHAGAPQLARFHAEAEAVAQLQHPGIVQIFEVGDHDGLPFFSLEFVEGGSLADKIDGKPRPPREAASTVEFLAQAMAAAHEHGIIHRDLKPANVLLTRDDQPKITDFGLAKRLEGDSELTQSGTLMGSPSYMSPEQTRGQTQDIGRLSDLYSLGAILYELLTGRPPFVGTSLLETLEQVRNQEPVPPSRLQPKVPRDLETICRKCLQKEPGKRYESCTALAEDLQRFLAGEPIRARPVGRAERLWRWCRRNPRVAALSAVVAVLLVAVAAGAVAIGMRASRERQAIAETRRVAGERLELAASAIAAGESRHAGQLLQTNLPLLDSRPELADVRSRLQRMRKQVDVYAEFKQLLDRARFLCFGSHLQKQEGQRDCRQLVKLYDQIETKTGVAAAGLPPLSEEQRQRFDEDVFDTFLIAAFVERDLAQSGDENSRKQAARYAIGLLNRANKIVPDTRTFYAHRCACWGTLGDLARDEADKQRAESIEPTVAVDHFWHGFAHHLRGDGARRRGERKAADQWYRQELAEYAAFLRLRPDHFWGYFNWSVAHVKLHEWQDALFGFTACIQLRPDFPWSYNNRGNVLLQLQHYDEAVEDCTTALQRDARYFQAYENRGLALLALGKTERAHRDFDRAIELNPDDARLYQHRAGTNLRMKRVAAALEDSDRAIALAADDADAYYRRAGIRVAAHQYAAARDDYSVVLDRVPRAVNVLKDRAFLNLLHLKDFDAAVADAERLSQLAPKMVEPYRILAVVALGRRRYDEALGACRKALERKPDNIDILWEIAQIRLWQGKPVEALAVVDPLVADLSPDHPESLNVRGDIYRSLDRLEEAAGDYERMIELRPKVPHAYVSLALVRIKQGKLDEARECYDRMVAANPDSAVVYLRRAEFRRDRGEFDQAEADCDLAAGKAPDSALPALVRASVTAARGEYQQAMADAEEALKKAPQDDGHVLYAAACVWSLASAAVASDQDLAQRYANRGAEFLAATFDKGFHDLIYPEHNRMIEDPALAAIRERPDVADLLAHRGK